MFLYVPFLCVKCTYCRAEENTIIIKKNLNLHWKKIPKASFTDKTIAKCFEVTKRKLLKSPSSTQRVSLVRSPIYTASFRKKLKSKPQIQALFQDNHTEPLHIYTPIGTDYNANHSDDNCFEAGLALGNVTCSLPENDVDGVPSPTEVQNILKYFVPSVVDKLSTDGRLELTILVMGIPH